MEAKDIFQREIAGEVIRLDDPEYPKIVKIIQRAYHKVSVLNNTSPADYETIRKLFFDLTGKEADDTFHMWPPFYTDFGMNITVGKNVFINHGCTFMDRGGITLEDNVLIGPKVNLVTTDHAMEIAERRNTISKPIVIKKNAWIGAAATITPGVIVGENSVVAAGAVVTRDVLPNVVVAGVPAKIIKRLN